VTRRGTPRVGGMVAQSHQQRSIHLIGPNYVLNRLQADVISEASRVEAKRLTVVV
jgi:hypothetical protein